MPPYVYYSPILSQASGSICPATCKTYFNDIDTACTGKQYTFDANAGSSGILKYDDDKFRWLLLRVNTHRYSYAVQDACDSVIHDQLIAATKTCTHAFWLGSYTSAYLFYCNSPRSTDTTCHANCQAYIDMMDKMCVGKTYVGDFDKPSDKTNYDASAKQSISFYGPKGCTYSTSAADITGASLGITLATVLTVLLVLG